MCSLAQRGSQNTNFLHASVRLLHQYHKSTDLQSEAQSGKATCSQVVDLTQDVSYPLDRFQSLTNTHSSFLVL